MFLRFNKTSNLNVVILTFYKFVCRRNVYIHVLGYFYEFLLREMHVLLCFTKFIFSYQKEEDDGGDMDSYQVLLLLLSILWHGAQLMLIASNFQMNKRTGASKSSFEIYMCCAFKRLSRL